MDLDIEALKSEIEAEVKARAQRFTKEKTQDDVQMARDNRRRRNKEHTSKPHSKGDNRRRKSQEFYQGSTTSKARKSKGGKSVSSYVSNKSADLTAVFVSVAAASMEEKANDQDGRTGGQATTKRNGLSSFARRDAAKQGYTQRDRKYMSAAQQVRMSLKLVDLDPERFDPLGILLATALQVQRNTHKPPTAANVTVPTTMQDVPNGPCGLAKDRIIPLVDEHQNTPGWVSSVLTTGFFRTLAFPHEADDCKPWYRDEDPRETMLIQLGQGTFPYNRVLVPWGEDRYEDQAIVDLAFHDYGQLRVRKIPKGSDHSAPRDAYYALYLGGPGRNKLAQLEHRKGFAKLGADAYFNRRKKLLGIKLPDGKLYTPDGEAGWASGEKCKQFCKMIFCMRRCKPARVGWKYAKLAFRGTLNFVATYIDHLYGLHLVVSNAIVTANFEEVAPDHPLRRLLTPFGYRTEAINVQAKNTLTNDRGLLHRSIPLTKKGLIAAFLEFAAPLWTPSHKWATIKEDFDVQGIDTVTLPLHEDGIKYYDIIFQFVNKYLSHFFDYSANECGNDQDIIRWYRRVGTIMPDKEALPQPLTCENLEKVVTNFVYRVTAEHRLVGTIQADNEDPCFAPWAWVEGELCGLPRMSFTQQITMAGTGLEQPKIVEDYSHMFEGFWQRNTGKVSLEKGKELWQELRKNLNAFHDTIDDINKGRKRAFRVFEPRNIETSIAI